MEKKHSDREYAGYWIRRFLCSYLTDVRNLSVNTIKSYRDAIRLLIAHICESRHMTADSILITDMSSKAILQMLDSLECSRNCSVKTRNLRLSAFVALAKFVAANSPEHIEWCREIRNIPVKKAPKTLITYLEKEEVREVLQGAETGDALTKAQYKFAKGQQMRDVAILTLLLHTGIRVSEMVGIDLQDIDWNEKRIRIFRKGRKEQYVYFNEAVQEALTDYIDYERKTASDDMNALFISRKGQRISVRAVERMVKKYTASVVPMKNITPHKLRSTFATNLYEETGDIYITSDALGHSSLETVKKYTNLSDERRRKAAEAIEKAYYEE